MRSKAEEMSSVLALTGLVDAGETWGSPYLPSSNFLLIIMPGGSFNLAGKIRIPDTC